MGCSPKQSLCIKSKHSLGGNNKVALVFDSLKVNGLSVEGGAFGNIFAFKSKHRQCCEFFKIYLRYNN